MRGTRDRGDGSRLRVPDAEAMAWLLMIPCALLALLAIHYLGPPLGRLLHPVDVPYALFPSDRQIYAPEPTEQARFLLAVAAPLLFVPLLVRMVARRPSLPATVVTAGGLLAGLLTACLVIACMVVQYGTRYGTLLDTIFIPGTLATAPVVAVAIIGAVRVRRVRRLMGSVPWPVALAVLGLAALFTANALLHAVNSDGSIASAHSLVFYNVQYPLDETFAVVNGRTPLVDFTAQYASLWPYVLALPLLALGKTLLAFTIAACTLSAIAMLAVFGVFRRVTRSFVAALLLYLPYVATSVYMIDQPLTNRSSPASYFALFPLRYAGPLLLAWLTARQLERARAKAAWPLFAAAGLVVLNNAEFGLGALVATLAAMLWTSDRPWPARLGSVARDAAIGLAAALAVVTALALVRASSLPDLGRLIDYGRLYAAGYHLGAIPKPLGVHIICYLTYVAAIVVATVRAIEHAPNRILTGMLVWSGIFGLGASTYFLGLSGPFQLKGTFGAWALALLLLTVVVVERLARRSSWRPTLAEAAVLMGAGVATCSLAQTLTPWAQLRHLTASANANAQVTQPYVPAPGTRRFIASVAYGGATFYLKRGAPVVILTPTGHRIADAYGIVNVSRYTGMDSIHTRERLHAVVDDLRRSGGNTLLIASAEDEPLRLLDRWGFAVLTRSGLRPYRAGIAAVTATLADGTTVMKWVDARNLRPPLLRTGRGAPVARYPAGG